MSYPVRIDEAVLKLAEEATIARESRNDGVQSPREVKDRYDQQIYLSALRRTFSPVQARMEAQVSAEVANRWRKEYHDYALAHNQILDEFGEQLVGSVMQRAMGYYSQKRDTAGMPIFNNDGSPVLETDPVGNPIVSGGNDKLALRMLEAIYPNKFGQKLSLSAPDFKPFNLTVAQPSAAVVTSA